MFEIIRIIFGVFIASQAVLLIAHQRIKLPVTQNGLKWSFILKVALIVAYSVYATLHFYPQEVFLAPVVFWAQTSMRLIISIFEVFLCLLVWFAFLQHTVKKDKIYQMYNLSLQKQEDNYKIYGTIREGAHEFDVVASISTADYMSLSASGYFDKAATHKTIPVRYFGFASGKDSYGVSFEVSLSYAD